MPTIGKSMTRWSNCGPSRILRRGLQLPRSELLNQVYRVHRLHQVHQVHRVHHVHQVRHPMHPMHPRSFTWASKTDFVVRKARSVRGSKITCSTSAANRTYSISVVVAASFLNCCASTASTHAGSI